MKLYISADIEGVTGVTDPDEVRSGQSPWEHYRIQMTREVAAACEGAFDAGAKEITVNDAHASGRNILGEDLPKGVRLIRGWSGHPYSMLECLDGSFDAIMMVGYHAKAGDNSNPLAHTIHGLKIHSISINGHIASELLINTYTALLEKVPVVMITGDAGICDEALVLNNRITTIAVKNGIGGATCNMHPAEALEEIRQGAKKAVADLKSFPLLSLPDRFDIIINYRDHKDAIKNSFYPGAKSISPREIQFETESYFEALRFFSFAIRS